MGSTSMRIFISSLISGMEPLRRAARNAVTALGHQPIMAEDFGARSSSPQVACLDGIRLADVVVLILCDRYGTVQPSGLSATHEEYREAKGRKPVLAFVQEGITPEPDQVKFISEIQGWESGLFRASFTEPADLQPTITRALHEWELANAVGPLDPENLLARALALIPREQRGYITSTSSLVVSITGGPTQSILRPAEIEDSALGEELLQAALFGEHRIFNSTRGSSKTLVGHALVLDQESGSASLRLDEQGAILITLPIERSDKGHGLPVLIEETVQRQLSAALGYAGGLLERLDPTQRLTHVAIATKIYGGGFLAWQTQREHDSSPNQIRTSISFGNEERAAVHLTPPHRPRAALRLDAGRLVQDLVVLLRRQWKS
jgi:hypothetical protein